MINVKEERVRRGLSQQELAHAAGIERAQLSRIEAGKVQPHAQTLHKLKSVIDNFRTNDVRTCRVHDLDDESVTYYDNKYLNGRTNLYKVKINTERNAPELHKGDTAFIDADEVDLNVEGYYLIDLPNGRSIHYVVPDFVIGTACYLYSKNKAFPSIGKINRKKLKPMGRLVHIGRDF